MLQNLIHSRLSGQAGIILPTPAQVREYSSQMAVRAKQRQDAAHAMAAGQAVRFEGMRLDAKDVSKDKRLGVASLRLRAVEHANTRADATIPQASQALSEIYNQVYDIQHADLAAWDGQFFDRKTDVDPAAEETVTYERDLVGAPRVASTYDVTSIPLVTGPVAGIGLRESILPFLVGYDTNFMTSRRTSLAVRNGKPDFMIEQGKIEMCHRAIAQAFNAMWLYGDVGSNISGLHTNPFIGNVPSSLGPWSALNAQQVTNELSKLFNFLGNQAQGGGLGDAKKVTVHLPPAQYDIARLPFIATTAGPSPWSVFRDSLGLADDALKKVHSLAAANSAVFQGGPLGLTRDRAYVSYKAGDMWDPRFIMSQPIEIPTPPRETGVGSVTYFHARGGGLWLPDARRVAFYEDL